jgi:tRNA-2-methylthio-N6-dimethylallyladenosine synthase
MTEAADHDGHLPKDVVQERYERLTALQDAITYEHNKQMVGRTEQLLVEGTSKKDPGKLTGRTRTNKLVHFDNDGSEPGSFQTVEISAAHPHHLEGVVVGEPGRSRSAMSLPLVSAGAGCSSCP